MYILTEDHKFLTIYCCGCGHSHVIMQVCKDRYCPNCGHVRRWRSRARLRQVLNGYKYQPGYMLKMLTVSRQNCTDLEKGISELIASFRRLRQTKFWQAHVLGGLFVIEITGRKGSWHPHIHSFIYSKRIPWEQLRDTWTKSSKGGTATWITNISNDKALFYVTKYVTKTNIPQEDRAVASESISGRRMFQRFGTFASIVIDQRFMAKKCDKCNSETWINEYDVKHLERSDGFIVTRLSEEHP